MRSENAKLKRRLEFLVGDASPEVHGSSYGLELGDDERSSSSSAASGAVASPMAPAASPPQGRWGSNVFTPQAKAKRERERAPAEREAVFESLRALQHARAAASKALVRVRTREKRVAQREAALRRRERGGEGGGAPLDDAERRQLHGCISDAYSIALSLRRRANK